MKLIIRKFWFKWSIDDCMAGLFRIPQLKEQFDEGFLNDCEIRPRGIKIYPGYYPADDILAMMPESKKDVYLVLSSMDLKGDYGRVHGKGYNRKAIASNNAFIDGFGMFDTNDIGFNAIVFHEIGHALCLAHHSYEPSDSCEMSSNEHLDEPWPCLEDIRFCDDCYREFCKITKIL
ncbi:MAG: hypothetical protein Q8N99_05000 [Nanoarchaeota archaeon]|nr:hypothetical protein [Nanoarchaeota archaeon]